MKKYLSKNGLAKIKNWALAHKLLSGVIIIILTGAVYYGYGKFTNTAGQTSYVLHAVQKGTIVSSITGSGQVSTSNQIDLKPKVSGNVVYVGVQNGQYVNQGQLIAEIDATDAKKNVRDAEVNLESAQIAMKKLTAPADTLSTLQTENALAQSQTGLEKAYEDGFSGVSNSFLDIPLVMTGMQEILYGTTLTKVQDNISGYSDLVKNYDLSVFAFRDDAAAKYLAARTVYEKNFSDYKTMTRSSSRTDLEALILETYNTTKTVSDSVKSTNDLLNFVKDRLVEHGQSTPGVLTSAQNSLSTHTGQINSHLVDLLNAKNTITTSNFTIAEKTESLAKLKRGADTLDLDSQTLAIKQRENALQDAKDNLTNYYIYAPFSGTIAKINVKKTDVASSGTSIATLITSQKLAEVSLNEVDVAKVKIEQKATLTFDAIDGLAITGKVAEIDSVGAVTQGVVTYTVKISFDTQDDRIKSGMSTSANIITNVKQDVLLIPNSGLKSKNNNSYVEIFDTLPTNVTLDTDVVLPTTPQQQNIVPGVSNDTETEIVSGLKEGDVIITKTTLSSTATKTTTPSLLNSLGGNRAATGGAARRLGQ